jgi:hypothetical protein
MTYKVPNKKAPRVRLKNVRIMNSKTLKEFHKLHPEHKGISLSEFNGIIKQFNENIIDTVVDFRYGVTLPERLGQLVIVSFPRPKRKVIDFGKSNELGERVYHANWDTNNRLGKLVYQNGGYGTAFRYNRLWGFTASRSFKTRVSNAFRKMYEKYIQIDNNGVALRNAINGK